MIQRIQTVWLAVACGALAALAFRAGTSSAGTHAVVAAVLSALAAAGAAGAVLLFRNRPQQRRIIVLVQVTVIVLAVALFGGMYLGGELHVRTAHGINAANVITILLPLAAYAALLLARRAVERDIKVVRSVDRLR